jgi:hypothetical protein
MAPPPPFEDTKLGAQALAYVIELYDELTVENGAPTLGTQNQAVDFIRADPELSRAVADWAKKAGIEEATTAPQQPDAALSALSWAVVIGIVIAALSAL